jgi:hypothetical protein
MTADPTSADLSTADLTDAHLVTAAGPSEHDVLEAFRLIDRRLADPADPADPVVLLALRDRLAGELVGDADRVAARLSPGFTLVTHAGGTTTTTREALLRGVRRQGATGGASLMWLRLTDLVVDTTSLAGQGSLDTLLTAAVATAAGRGRSDLTESDLLFTTVPIAFVIRFDGQLMASETLYLDAGSSRVEVLGGEPMPDSRRLLGLVDGQPETTGR